ncbi:MAG: hypothetical protein FJ144_07435 [Deltaproteobacteria bacterium]|nr:hypothetical protein [Deltaproteobacteria bacterium]
MGEPAADRVRGDARAALTRRATRPAARERDARSASRAAPDGRLHDLDNLYATDGSVFPTSSGDDPTLTIIASALRIAHRIAGTPPVIP